jgi:hypothetical protein
MPYPIQTKPEWNQIIWSTYLLIAARLKVSQNIQKLRAVLHNHIWCRSYFKQLFKTTDDVKENRSTVPSPRLSVSPNSKFGLPIFETLTQVKETHKLWCPISSILTKNQVNNLVKESADHNEVS